MCSKQRILSKTKLAIIEHILSYLYKLLTEELKKDVPTSKWKNSKSLNSFTVNIQPLIIQKHHHQHNVTNKLKHQSRVFIFITTLKDGFTCSLESVLSLTCATKNSAAQHNSPFKEFFTIGNLYLYLFHTHSCCYLVKIKSIASY